MSDPEARFVRADVSIAIASRTSPRNGLVAWGAVLRSGPHAKAVGGSSRPDAAMTTSGAAIHAIQQAVRQLNRPCRLTIRSGSYYIQQSIPNLARWARANWERADNTGLMLEPVANAHLWQALLGKLRTDGHLVSGWEPVGGYRSFETTRVGDVLHINPVGPKVPRIADDTRAAEMAVAALQRALLRPVVGPSADADLQAPEANAFSGRRP